MSSKLLSSHCEKLLLSTLCLFGFAFASAIPTLGQDDQTQSAADAARAARAKHEPPENSTSAPAPHPPLSQLQILAWQIAGVTTPDLLLQLKANGIAFSPDDPHLNALKEAQLPADGVPDDSAEIEVHEPRIDDPRGRPNSKSC
jgi:hypothetical protein